MGAKEARLQGRLGAIEAELSRLVEQSKTNASRQEELWAEAYEIFDQLDGVGASARYLFSDGMVLGRIMAKHPQDGALDLAALEKALTPEQWKACTRRVRLFDEKKTEKAAKKDSGIQTAIANCTVSKPRVPRRHFRLAPEAERTELEQENKVVPLSA